MVAVAANLAGGFVLGPIMFLGMLSLLLGFVSSWVSLPLNLVAGLFIGFLLEVAKFFGRLSFAVYEWQGVSLWMALALGLGAEAALFWVLGAARRRPAARLHRAAAPARLRRRPDRRRRGRRTRERAGRTGGALDPGAHVPRCGRGRGRPVARSRRPDRAHRRRPRAARPAPQAARRDAVDLLVVSHAHADHAAGLSDVVARLPVRTALLPSPPEPSDGLRRLAAELSAAGVGVHACTQAVTAQGDGWSVSVLPTRPPPGESGNQGENDAALVVLVTISGHRLLVPGDAEGEVLAQLELPPCDVVELPHHGSRGGFDEAPARRAAAVARRHLGRTQQVRPPHARDARPARRRAACPACAPTRRATSR